MSSSTPRSGPIFKIPGNHPCGFEGHQEPESTSPSSLCHASNSYPPHKGLSPGGPMKSTGKHVNRHLYTISSPTLCDFRGSFF